MHIHICIYIIYIYVYSDTEEEIMNLAGGCGKEGWRDVDAAHMHEGLKNNHKNEHLSKRDLRGKAIPLKRPLKAQYLDITVKVLREKSKMPLWQNKPTHNLKKKKGFNHLFH